MSKADEEFQCKDLQEEIDSDYEVEKLRIKAGNYTVCEECGKEPGQHEALCGKHTIKVCSKCALADMDLPKDKRKYSFVAW